MVNNEEENRITCGFLKTVWWLLNYRDKKKCAKCLTFVCIHLVIFYVELFRTDQVFCICWAVERFFYAIFSQVIVTVSSNMELWEYLVENVANLQTKKMVNIIKTSHKKRRYS